MDIREINKSELQGLLALYQHLHASDDPFPDSNAVNEVWGQINSDDSLRYFGLYDSGHLVSSCTISIIPNLTRGCRPYGVIENVVTHGEFRRKGYGRAVLQHTLAHAWMSKCYKVMLLTGRMDEETYLFYESAGYERGKKQAFEARPDHA